MFLVAIQSMIITILLGVLYLQPSITIIKDTPTKDTQVLSAEDLKINTPTPVEVTIFPTIIELPLETPTPEPTPTSVPTLKPTLKPSVVPTLSPFPTQISITITPTNTPPTPTIVKTNSEEINHQIDTLGAKYKVDPNVIRHIALCESGFNPLAENYIYAGLFQFSPSTWASYRSQMHLDQNPLLRYSSFDAIETAAYALSIGDSRIWPNCYPK